MHTDLYVDGALSKYFLSLSNAKREGYLLFEQKYVEGIFVGQYLPDQSKE